MASASSNPNSQYDTVRWNHFNSAIGLAIQRASHKWTFEDFCECFPVWSAENKHAATSLFSQISTYQETDLNAKVSEVFERYNARESINRLHTLVLEAKDRDERGEDRTDVWKEDIEPSNAVFALTVPKLEEENQRMREALAELKAENEELRQQLEEENGATNKADETTATILNKLDFMYSEWMKLPMDEMEAWMIQTMEARKAEE